MRYFATKSASNKIMSITGIADNANTAALIAAGLVEVSVQAEPLDKLEGAVLTKYTPPVLQSTLDTLARIQELELEGSVLSKGVAQLLRLAIEGRVQP